MKSVPVNLKYGLCFFLVLFTIPGLSGCKQKGDSGSGTYDVVITGVVDSQNIIAIKGVREVTDLGLKDAKDLVDGIPSVVKQGLSKSEAEKVAEKLKQSSLIVEVRQH